MAIAAVTAVIVGAGAAGVAVVAGQPRPSHPVPELRGLDETAAGAALAPLHLHLAVTSRSYNPTVAAGRVETQTPDSGRLREGASIGVTVSLGPQPIPVPADLAGTPKADAERVITTLGLAVGAITQGSSETVPVDSVISSSPSGGTLLPGQPVALVVSSGRPLVAVPSIVGHPASAARSALAAAALPVSETEQYSDTVASGNVVSSSLPAGASVHEGTAVTLVVSKGPDVVTVPPVRTLAVTAAAQALTTAGLVVTGVNGNPTATTTGTQPAAGAVVHRGTAVTIITG